MRWTHGIESPQEREEAGKSRKGRITFTAENTVGELRLSLSDDGKGIDELKIRERAREKGFLPDLRRNITARKYRS